MITTLWLMVEAYPLACILYDGSASLTFPHITPSLWPCASRLNIAIVAEAFMNNAG